jgi:hypothetical protein
VGLGGVGVAGGGVTLVGVPVSPESSAVLEPPDTGGVIVVLGGPLAGGAPVFVASPPVPTVVLCESMPASTSPAQPNVPNPSATARICSELLVVLGSGMASCM